MKRIVIVGATSGIGYEVALNYIRMGWYVGIAGRRLEPLQQLQLLAPTRIAIQQIDITTEQADRQLQELIDRIGGMDIYFHSSGIGNQNRALDSSIELATGETNVVGFMRMIDQAFRYFRNQGGGHIAIISSIAGTKGLGSAPAYSATKRFQSTYINALNQLSHFEHLNITFTDIKPGFVRTALLKHHYPLILEPEQVAKQIVKAVTHKKRRIVIDYRYAIIVFLWRLIPEWIWERIRITTKQ